MPEITVTGVNALTFPNMATWGWEISLYLFLGGLVAGLMIFSGTMRLVSPGRFARALVVSDLASLPLLGIGMLFLLFDLSNKINVWRFYTTFQVRSAMSWGAWMLVAAMIVLALRFVSRVPAPMPLRVLGLKFFPPPPADDEEAVERIAQKLSPVVRLGEWAWTLLHQIARWTNDHNRGLAIAGVALGIGVGFYTGVLLSTIPSRPLWNTAVLAPLFLVSGLASGGAFLCLFLPDDEHLRLVPFSILFCGVELVLLLAYIINFTFGNNPAQRAGSLLFGGTFGVVFWALVVLIGLIVPALIEQLEVMHRRLPLVPMRLPPALKLTGGLALRFVIVYAGLLSFI